ncbi:MAG: hypothetical protein IKG55_00900, partial [Solobacterium sp.]|nr:hypothetical protein [Solobacterium sp.]
MGWFENQIEERQNADQQLLDDSFGKVSEAVLGTWHARRAADGNIGSEGTGMSRLVKENCDILVKIPMTEKINSLNASVSAGII